MTARPRSRPEDHQDSLQLVELIVVRHARPVRQEVPEGQSADPGLSELGHQQAKATAAYLADQGVDHVASSSMLRATSTAVALAERLGTDVETLDDLRESDHRSHIYIPVEEIDRSDGTMASLYSGDLHEKIFSGGYEGFRRRVVRGFEHLIRTRPSRTVVVYCHAMVTAVYLQSVLEIDDPFKLLIDYCGISRVLASSTGRRSVRSINETAHVRDLLER